MDFITPLIGAAAQGASGRLAQWFPISSRRSAAYRLAQESTIRAVVRLMLLREYAIIARRPLGALWNSEPYVAPAGRALADSSEETIIALNEMRAAGRAGALARFEQLLTTLGELGSLSSVPSWRHARSRDDNEARWQAALDRWSDQQRRFQFACAHPFKTWRVDRQSRKKRRASPE
jgi:hypothetical protein